MSSYRVLSSFNLSTCPTFRTFVWNAFIHHNSLLPWHCVILPIVFCFFFVSVLITVIIILTLLFFLLFISYPHHFHQYYCHHCYRHYYRYSFDTYLLYCPISLWLIIHCFWFILNYGSAFAVFSAMLVLPELMKHRQRYGQAKWILHFKSADAVKE